MTEPRYRVITHGGAGAPEAWHDGTEQAAQAGLEALDQGENLLEAACRAVAMMEDDGRFNAGTGSNLRRDGSTLQMDAAVATSAGDFGAVACIEQVRHPIHVARQVAATEQLVLAGSGATAFARQHGHEAYDPVTDGSRRLYKRALADRQAGDRPDHGEAGHVEDAGDTVGAIATDGRAFAAALSSGGTALAPVGRVGDVPLPGCGLAAGPPGAVACTGDGEAIARRRAADRAYRLLEDGTAAEQVAQQAVTWFEQDEEVFGLIVLTPQGAAGASNREMPWSLANPGL